MNQYHEAGFADRWKLAEPDQAPQSLRTGAYDAMLKLTAEILDSVAAGPGLTGLARGAVAHQLHQALRPLILDLDRIGRVGTGPPRNLGRISRPGRWWVCANALDRRAREDDHMGSLARRQPHRKGEETCHGLEPSWDGCAFVIVNPRTRSFRAWPSSYHVPTPRPDPAPRRVRDALAAIELPERAWPTALLRLLLAHAPQRRRGMFLVLDESGHVDWTPSLPDDPNQYQAVLPQRYVMNAIRTMGRACGIRTRYLSKKRFEAVWNGTVFKLRETIRVEDWWAPRAEAKS